jgi:hypothetical protein
MKISWGTGIAIFYSCFVIAMVSMVVMSARNKSDLVQENYYQKDLNYEAFRVKRQNASRMSQPARINYIRADKQIRIQLPKEMAGSTGQVSMFRASDKSLDLNFDLSLNEEAIMNIPSTGKFLRGLWTIQVEWESEGKSYYAEEEIIL